MQPLTPTRLLNWITPTPTAPSLNLQAWSGHLALPPYPNPARCFCWPAVWERWRYALGTGHTGLETPATPKRLSRQRDLPQKALPDLLAERFYAYREPLSVQGFCVCAGDIRHLVLVVGRRFKHHLGDLLTARILGRAGWIHENAHDLLHQARVSRVRHKHQRAGYEVRFDSAWRHRLDSYAELAQLLGEAFTPAFESPLSCVIDGVER